MDAAVTIGGESLTQSQWAKKLGVTRGAIYFRKKKYGETSEQAVLHFYNRKRWRNLDRFATAPDAEAAFASILSWRSREAARKRICSSGSPTLCGAMSSQNTRNGESRERLTLCSCWASA